MPRFTLSSISQPVYDNATATHIICGLFCVLSCFQTIVYERCPRLFPRLIFRTYRCSYRHMWPQCFHLFSNYFYDTPQLICRLILPNQPFSHCCEELLAEYSDRHVHTPSLPCPFYKRSQNAKYVPCHSGPLCVNPLCFPRSFVKSMSSFGRISSIGEICTGSFLLQNVIEITSIFCPARLSFRRGCAKTVSSFILELNFELSCW